MKLKYTSFKPLALISGFAVPAAFFFAGLAAWGREAQSDYLYLGENPVIAADVLHPAPADGDTVLNDAPGFNWLPEEGAQGFILELSRDPDFPEGDILLEKAKTQGPLIQSSFSSTPQVVQGRESWLVSGLPLCLYHPSFKLGSGRWAWRWRCVFEGNELSPPSAARQFVVSRDAVEYVVPPVAKLLSRIPTRHPRLFLQPEELDDFRSLIDISEPHRRLWERIEACADTLLELPIMQEPPPDPEGPFDYSFWRNYYDQARKMGQVLDFLSFCYLVSGDTKWSDRAREWLLALTKWDPEGRSSMKNFDEVAMPVLLNGARAYDWIYDALSEEERTVIRQMLIVRGEQAYDRWWEGLYHIKPFSSHATRLVNYMSQVACVLYGEAEEPEKWLGYILPMVTTFYPAWGGRDGGYSEGPSYWMMYFNYMLQSAFCIEKAMGLDIMKKPFYRNNGYYKIYAYPYFARQLPFGDTGIGDYWPADKINLYHLATVYRNPYFRWRAENSKPAELPVNETVIPTGVISFFWLDEGPGHVEARPPDDLPRAYVFRDVGLAALHQDLTDPDETFMLLKSSPYGAWSHIYADQNSFYIQGFGEALAIQSGYYPHYGHPHHVSWTWNTHAHNSVLVDGQGQKIRDRASRGRIIAFSVGSGLPGSMDYAAGDATEAYEGRLERFVRRVFYQRPHDFLIVDELEAPKPVTYDWLLHALEQMDIDQAAKTVTIRKGKARLTVEFLSPDELVFSQNNKFTDPPGEIYGQPGNFYPDQWHLTVSTAKKAKAAVFMVKMKVWQVE
ncbi:MAG TPA: DUF4962 domain-containing protein [archaeon]|nr:DUF4962 domain-containing protein [archaeon]